MSPLEIPGTSLHIPYPPGEQECSSCEKDFSTPDVKVDGDTVTVHCPHCSHILQTYSKKDLAGDK